MRLNRNIGMLLLGVWLLLTGLAHFVPMGIPSLDVVLAVLAIVAGVLILVGR